MPAPARAVAFDEAVDPKDELDHIIPCSPILEDGEEIASYTLTLLAEAVALGLTIMSGSGRDHALAESNQSIKLWLTIDSGSQADPAFDDIVNLPIEVTIVTNSSPARKRQFTALLPVVQK
jgi:hypothetical protein